MTATALERLQALLDAATAEAPKPAPTLHLDPRLHDYQVTGVQHLRTHPHAGLFLEMGLGKTAITLQALTPDHLPALVIAPKRVAEQVWPTEVPKWRPDLTIAVAAGTPAKRAAALAAGADVTAIGRDNIKDIRPGQFRTIVIDELSGFKGRGARWETAKTIVERAQYVWGLTGTPSPNGYMDLWAQVFLLDGGEALGKTLGSADPKWGPPKPYSFRGRYYEAARTHRRTGVIIDWKMKPGAKEQIEERLAVNCLSMRAVDHLTLPPATYNEVIVPMDRKTAKVYDQMVEDLVAQVESGAISAANAAVATGKLSQITAGFLYGDEDDDPTVELHSAKIDAALEVVEGTGSPVLVFYRFRWEREALLARLGKDHDVRTIDEKGVIDAWNRGEVEVLLAHPASAGHGLNLQEGGNVIAWATMPWSLEEWSQANARLNRQGQKNPVIIHQLITPDTVDVAIQDRLAGKASVQEALMKALRKEPR